MRQGSQPEVEAFVHGALCVSYSGQASFGWINTRLCLCLLSRGYTSNCHQLPLMGCYWVGRRSRGVRASYIRSQISLPQACRCSPVAAIQWMLLPCNCHATVMQLLPCNCHATATSLPCNCHATQCFSSEAWGGRSANRGQCAQACRKPYGKVSACFLVVRLTLQGMCKEC